MILSSQQIRAGRGLLNLSQRELAENAGLSLNALNNIERDVGNPRADTLQNIRNALEGQGVEFLEGHGVRLKGEILDIEKIEGPDIVTLLNHFYNDFLSVLQAGGEVLYMGIDNRRFEHNDKERLRAYKRFEDEAIRREINERLLFLEGDLNFLSRRNNYRWVPKELFGEIPMAIYGDNVSIILWGPPMRLVVIRNAAIAETFRRQFDAIWSLGKPVPDEIHEFHRIKEEEFM